MSFKSAIVKMAIEWTPKMMVMWVANMMLKGIAELKDYSIDLDARKAYAQIMLCGEVEWIEVWLDGFAIVEEEESRYFVLDQGQSNRLWLNNLLSRVAGKAWKVPVIPQLKPYLELISELIKAEEKEVEDE